LRLNTKILGTAELHTTSKELIISSWIITYGHAATPQVTKQIREEIETMWNEPGATIYLHKQNWQVRFRINALHKEDLKPEEVYYNTNPQYNYFRIEEYAQGNISFVDGLGCNTGYFKLDNLYKGSTTAAHEYGHTLGLEHPEDIDYRGKGVPGIMFPRGTLVDPQFQYEPDKPAGTKGGTMHPMYRRVHQTDVDLLRLHRLSYNNKVAVIGEFTSLWHEAHLPPDN
jgi:hypothetical protein